MMVMMMIRMRMYFVVRNWVMVVFMVVFMVFMDGSGGSLLIYFFCSFLHHHPLLLLLLLLYAYAQTMRVPVVVRWWLVLLGLGCRG